MRLNDLALLGHAHRKQRFGRRAIRGRSSRFDIGPVTGRVWWWHWKMLARLAISTSRVSEGIWGGWSDDWRKRQGSAPPGCW